MIHEAAFAVEAAACSRVSPRLLRRVARHRVPRFGVVGQKLVQIVANRPDVRLPFDDDGGGRGGGGGGVVRDALARVVEDPETGARTVRASVATVTRSPCGRYAVKQCNDPATPAYVSALSRVVRVFSRDADDLLLAPLADEVRLESERRKNVALRASLRACAARVTVPRVVSSTRERVVMEYAPATLARDLRAPVPLADVRELFRELVWAAARTGVVHADLHAGNVGVRRSAARATEFVIYDFGAVRRLDVSGVAPRPAALARVAEAAVFGAVSGSGSGSGASSGSGAGSGADGDWTDRVADEARACGLLVGGSRENVRATLVASVRYACGACDFAGLRPAFAAAGGDVRLAPDAARMLGALAVLEATCKRMNPDFDAAGALLDPRSAWGALAPALSAGRTRAAKRSAHP